MGPAVKRWRTSMLPKKAQPGTLGQNLSQDLRHDAASQIRSDWAGILGQVGKRTATGL